MIKELKREKWTHKGMNGRLLVISGSYEYIGTPLLVGLAAYRTGIDLLHITSPELSAMATAVNLPEAIIHVLKGKYISRRHYNEITRLIDTVDAVVIGNGISKNKETLETGKRIIRYLVEHEKRAVIDGDLLIGGMNASKNIVLTPHAGELERMINRDVSIDINDRKRLVMYAAQSISGIVLLKGAIDVISDGFSVYLNKTGCPEMSVAGTGDVLAGIIGALLAQGVEPLRAAILGARINGIAGMLARREKGISLIARDVIENIPRAIKKI
ncbi:NAD(P)H-hydrate dehydratase [Candidatus Woesearchaeota archaeon]|nr:NAD(P)H-hydrate dehydratase [Candidatus Woesearchaeota archaeon]